MCTTKPILDSSPDSHNSSDQHQTLSAEIERLGPALFTCPTICQLLVNAFIELQATAEGRPVVFLKEEIAAVMEATVFLSSAGGA